MNYVQGLFLGVVFMHIASGLAAAAVVILGFLWSPLEVNTTKATNTPQQNFWEMLSSLHGAEVGVTPVRWESWLSPPPSGSSVRLRDVVLFERRLIFSCVKADPFGTSLLKEWCGMKKGLRILKDLKEWKSKPWIFVAKVLQQSFVNLHKLAYACLENEFSTISGYASERESVDSNKWKQNYWKGIILEFL